MHKICANTISQFLHTFMLIFAIIYLLHVCLGQDDLSSVIRNMQEEPQDYDNTMQQNQSQDQVAEMPKILRLEITTSEDYLTNQTFYIGQYVTISYRLMLFDNARIVYTEFTPSFDKNTDKKAKDNHGVALIKSSDWSKNEDYWDISYTFKILRSRATIPALVVHVQNNNIQDSMQTNKIELKAQNLSSNHLFSNVVASSLKVIDYTLEIYDDKNNMVLIELEGQNSNLEDFHLRNINEQEFGQGTKFGIDIARANVLALVPKSLESINFSYFNIDSNEFIDIKIPNIINVVAQEDSTKEDLNPKNSFLGIINIGIISLLVICSLMTLFKRSYFLAIISVLLLCLLIYRFFSNTYAIKTLPNTKVFILPTPNSTELLTISNPAKLQAIDKRNGFYKVYINSTKVGWIDKAQVR